MTEYLVLEAERLEDEEEALILDSKLSEELQAKTQRRSSPAYLCILLMLPAILALWIYLFSQQVSSPPQVEETNSNVSKCIQLTPQIHLQPAADRKNYLTITNAVGGAGFCNELFEVAALVGIAASLNRIPYLNIQSEGALGVLRSIVYPVFPRLVEQISVVHWPVKEKEIYHFHMGTCCTYNDTSVFKNSTEEYLKLDGLFFQSFKYFDHIRADLREWLQPNKTVQAEAESHLPINFRSHFMICVHIRRGDFLTDNWHAASEANFSSLALDYLMNKYTNEGKKVAGAILGADSIWETDVFGGRENVFVIHNSIAEDFAFTRRYCDVLLITSPTSTFGWFMGYLSKSFNVYYRDIMSTTDKGRFETKQEDFYLPEWTKIREENGTIVEVR